MRTLRSAAVPRNLSSRSPSAAPSRGAPVPVLVRVPFHGAELHAVRVGAEVLVVVRKVCDDLGLAVQSQLAKLHAASWACVTMIVMQVPGDQQRREIACISLDALPMWLATIHESKVAEHIRPRLALFQREAKQALAAHFFGEPTPRPKTLPLSDPYLAAALELVGPVDERVLRAVRLLPCPRGHRLAGRVAQLREACSLLPSAPPASPQSILPQGDALLEEVGRFVAQAAAAGMPALGARWSDRLKAFAAGATWESLAEAGDVSAMAAVEYEATRAQTANHQHCGVPRQERKG